MICPEIFMEVSLRNFIRSKAVMAKSVDGIIMFSIVGPHGGIWIVDLRRDGPCDVFRAKMRNPDLHIIVREEFLETLFSGEFDPRQAVTEQKLGLEGNVRYLAAFIRLAQETKRAQQVVSGLSEPPKSAGFGLRR